MRLQVLSDAHIDFHADDGKEFIGSLDSEGVDVLLIAGDLREVGKSNKHFEALKALTDKYPKVVYVPGNHEYYREYPEHVERHLKEYERELHKKLAIPLNEVVELGEGKRVIGGTMWFKDDYLNNQYRDGFNDFYQIRNFDPWVYRQNARFVELLKRELGEGDIVLTHHAPSVHSMDPRYNPGYDRFYYTDVEQLVIERRPRLWVHGHVHTPVHYSLGRTEVVSNPFGYPKEGVGRFVDKYIIDI